MTRLRDTIAIAAFLLITSTGMAQSEEDGRNVVPELAGAEPVTGSMLVDGKLPAPFLDYIISVGDGHSQKVSIFQNGLVTVSTTIDDRKSMKKVLFPEGAIDTYREYLSIDILKTSRVQPLIGTPTRLRETIRIYDGKGVAVERTYDPSLYLPSEIEGARALLQDLARILSEDNEITNPMIDYYPVAGDQLLDLQMEAWKVVRVVNDHVEVQSKKSPLRAWIKADQLDEQFMSWSRPDQPAE